jgi:hypothetical protein
LIIIRFVHIKCRKSMSYEAVGFDYIEEEREMEDFDNEFEDENYGRDGGELGLDDYDMVGDLAPLVSI